MNIFSETLRRERENAGLTCVALAKQIGVSRQTWYRYEAGSFLPSYQTLRKILTALRAYTVTDPRDPILQSWLDTQSEIPPSAP